MRGRSFVLSILYLPLKRLEIKSETFKSAHTPALPAVNSQMCTPEIVDFQPSTPEITDFQPSTPEAVQQNSEILEVYISETKAEEIHSPLHYPL